MLSDCTSLYFEIWFLTLLSFLRRAGSALYKSIMHLKCLLTYRVMTSVNANKVTPESSLLRTQNNQKALDLFDSFTFRSTAWNVFWYAFNNTSPTFALIRNEKWRKAREARYWFDINLKLRTISDVTGRFPLSLFLLFLWRPVWQNVLAGFFLYSTGNRKIYNFLFARFTDLDFSQLTDHGKWCHQQNSNDVISGNLLLRYDTSGSASFETPPETTKTLSV